MRAWLLSLLFSFAAPAVDVSLAWDGVPQAVRYTVYYGNAPGTYTALTNTAGRQTNLTVRGLSESLPWHFTCTAWSASNLESGPSNEVSWNAKPSVEVKATIQRGPPWVPVTNVTFKEKASGQGYYRAVMSITRTN